MGHSSVPCLSQEHPPALKLLPQALEVLTDPILLAPSSTPTRGLQGITWGCVGPSLPAAAGICSTSLAQLWDGCDGGAEAAAAHSPGSCPLCAQNLGELQVQKCSGGALEKVPESGTSPGQKRHHHLPLQPFALAPGWGTSLVPAQCRGAGPGCGVGKRPHRKPQHGHIRDG